MQRDVGRFAASHGRVHEVDAVVGHGIRVEFAQPVIAHTSDEGSVQSQSADARDGVRHSATGGLQAVVHRSIKLLCAVLFDQLHDAFVDAHVVQKCIIRMGDYIYNGVADPDEVIGLHSVLSLYWQRSLMMQVRHWGLRALQ